MCTSRSVSRRGCSRHQLAYRHKAVCQVLVFTNARTHEFGLGWSEYMMTQNYVDM